MMTFVDKTNRGRTLVLFASSFCVLSGLVTAAYSKESASDHKSHAANSAESSVAATSLAEQLLQLQNKVAQLEVALQQNHQAPASTSKAMMGMGGMQGGSKSGMGMMGGKMGMMSGMSSQQSDQSDGSMNMGGMKKMSKMNGMSKQGMSSMGGMSGMGMMGGKGMSMMGKMPGMGMQAMPSLLPGFPGASHIYHIGSTGFFLDHPQHITLTQEQQTTLNQIKQKTFLGQATFDRWEGAAEQELWLLTSADAPEASQIEAKVRETEKIRGDKRIAFIRAIGEAASVLTNEQRQRLAGTLPLDHTSQGSSN